MSNTETDAPSIYEINARNAKAGVVAAFFVASFERIGKLDQASRALTMLSQEVWDDAAFRVGQNPLSDESKAAVIVIVKLVADAMRELPRE